MTVEYSKAAYFVTWTLQSKDKQFTGLNGTKCLFARLPKVHLCDIRLRRQKVEPSIVGVGNEKIDHKWFNNEIRFERPLAVGQAGAKIIGLSTATSSGPKIGRYRTAHPDALRASALPLQGRVFGCRAAPVISCRRASGWSGCACRRTVRGRRGPCP